jgi:hypothetical protein
MRRSSVFLAAIAAFSVLAPSATAQDVIKRGAIQWIPPSGQNGVEASIEYVIEYGTYMQEPTRKASARATVGNRVHYNGQVYTRSEVGDDLFDDFEFGPINIEADVMVGTARISTVRHTYLLSGDIPGSPSWSKIFPGVSAEGAKDAKASSPIHSNTESAGRWHSYSIKPGTVSTTERVYTVSVWSAPSLDAVGADR